MHYAPWTFCILTFGCKVNQYESQSVREAWQRMDGAETDAPAEADVILLNTCAVTANAVTDARQAVRRKPPFYTNSSESNSSIFHGKIFNMADWT